MKVLFVSSGRLGKTSELIRNQGNSLEISGAKISYFTLKRGILGYISGIFSIRRLVRKGGYDIIHAHYSLSAFIAFLASEIPVVASLMGSDSVKPFLIRRITRYFSSHFWAATIVKTEGMKYSLGLEKAYVIPNGVDLSRFRPISRNIAREKIGFPGEMKLIVFIADPSREEKNYKLAVEAVKGLKMHNAELMPVYNTPNDQIPYYLNASDALLLTSRREGSVNVVKEAMACNVPVISTDVGDVRENTKGLPGCYICETTPESLTKALIKALTFKERMNSRDRIIELGLDSGMVAQKILDIYVNVLNEAG